MFLVFVGGKIYPGKMAHFLALLPQFYFIFNFLNEGAPFCLRGQFCPEFPYFKKETRITFYIKYKFRPSHNRSQL